MFSMQQILHDARDTFSQEGRDIADTVDAYIEKKLVSWVRPEMATIKSAVAGMWWAARAFPSGPIA
jgi:hypothetical protein